MYYKSTFIGDHNILSVSDEDKILLAQNAGYLLALAENTLQEVKSTQSYQIFEDEDKVTVVYFKEEVNDLFVLLESLKEINKKISMYIFSWGSTSVYEDIFEDFENLTLKTIPQPILDIYKKYIGDRSMSRYKPFEFQEEAIEKLTKSFLSLWDSSARKCNLVFKSPTGSGKTFMLTHFVNGLNNLPNWDFDKAFIWITFSDTLAMQSKDKFTEYFNNNLKNNLLTVEDFKQGKLEKMIYFLLTGKN